MPGENPDTDWPSLSKFFSKLFHLTQFKDFTSNSRRDFRVRPGKFGPSGIFRCRGSDMTVSFIIRTAPSSTYLSSED